jgi:deoxyribonuclease IV
VIPAERASVVLCERVAIALPVGSSQEGCDDLEVPLAHPAGLAPEVREPEVDIQLEELDPRRSLRHVKTVVLASDGMKMRFGPARVPSRESPEAAIELLLERGYTACEIDFEGGFWMKHEWEWAGRFGELASKNKLALSVHAPIAAILGHLRGDEQKRKRAFGMLDHTAGVAVACGAELVVVHPGYLLGRTRHDALKSVAKDLSDLHERLEAKERGVAFGVEIMGRVRELGTPEDVFWLAARLDRVRPVVDFAHLHAVTDGAFLEESTFAGVLAAADEVLEPGAPFHVHFSDIAYANRNETKHLSYGEGTLRAEPLRDALKRFKRPATVISESPDHESHQAIKTVLLGSALKSSK